MLTARMRLDDRVSHQVGNALALPFPDGAFDLVWTQNSGMNIADKEGSTAASTGYCAPAAAWRCRSPWPARWRRRCIR
jgi:hypothetical protein